MKVKLLCLGLASLGIATVAMADGNRSAELKVTGKISPNACKVQFNLPNDTADFGTHHRDELSKTSATTFSGSGCCTMSIDCGSSPAALYWTTASGTDAWIPPSVFLAIPKGWHGLGEYESKDKQHVPMRAWAQSAATVKKYNHGTSGRAIAQATNGQSTVMLQYL